MKVTIDFDEKTITVSASVPVGELMKFVQTLENWEEYQIVTTTIENKIVEQHTHNHYSNNWPLTYPEPKRFQPYEITWRGKTDITCKETGNNLSQLGTYCGTGIPPSKIGSAQLYS